MAQQYDHFLYCSQLVEKLKLFSAHTSGAFHKASNSDTLISISQMLSGISYPVLVAIDGKDSEFTDNDAEQLLKRPQYYIMILMPASNDNNEAILSAETEAEANALQIVALMSEHKLKLSNGLHALDKSSFSIHSTPAMGDILHGVIMGFSIDTAVSTKIDKNFWL